MLKQFLRPALAWLLCLSVGAAIYLALPHGKDSWLGRKLEEPMGYSKLGLYNIVQRDIAIAPGYNGRLSYNQFNAKWREYLKDKMSDADMLALCDRVLTQDAGGDAFYRARVYTARGFVFFIQDNLTAAEENALLAMAEDSEHGFGQYLMYYILEKQGLAAEAADMLKAAWKGGEFAASDKKWFDEKLAELRASAMVLDSRTVQKNFLPDTDAETDKVGQYITVRGKLLAIGDLQGRASLELEGDRPGREIICTFRSGDTGQIEKITPGQTVTIYGCYITTVPKMLLTTSRIVTIEP